MSTSNPEILRIYCDLHLDEVNLQRLRDGVAPHVIVQPAELTTSVLSGSGTDPIFATADIALGQPGVESVLSSPRLRWLQVTTAGFTRYDTAEFRSAVQAKHLPVTNSSNVYARPCAEHVMAFMLAQARQLPLALSTRSPNGSPEWKLVRSGSRSLQGTRVVILGYGTIATYLVDLLRPFDMLMVAVRRKPRGDEPIPAVTEEALPEVLAEADHVINILPENAASIHFFNAERFAQMKPGAIFYNIGRGTTVDQQALYDTLYNGRLGAAWLDVTDPEPLPDAHPLWSLPNCHITPHTAGGHSNETGTLVQHFLDNFQRYQSDDPLVDRIM